MVLGFQFLLVGLGSSFGFGVLCLVFHDVRIVVDSIRGWFCHLHYPLAYTVGQKEIALRLRH